MSTETRTATDPTLPRTPVQPYDGPTGEVVPLTFWVIFAAEYPKSTKQAFLTKEEAFAELVRQQRKTRMHALTWQLIQTDKIN